ncbi:type III pantothenate kinase [Echinicola sp. CAU 1574]|uniref:Type III pantothenate kinase n=1 Tax=Echinicola arenosa TaxID=2774144 RepID=A0ABR9AJ08_9BACT|nr:type III pantothenate kinase [Echinicola arenosa]MBD8488695.1 type III pantothenate kinase [Echinicola arenosa]
MFLSIDAGNSNIVFGFYDNGSQTWKYEHRVETKREVSVNKLAKDLQLFFLEMGLKPIQVKQIGISSVVPEINRTLISLSESFFNITPHFINEHSYSSVNILTTRPAEMGTDLMANAVAAFEAHRSACIIVDFGTALTFTVISDKGEIIGVNIVPGLKTALKSLFRNTSKLPEVKLELPTSAIGKNTIHSIQAGILYGYSGLVKGMLQTIQQELSMDFTIIATGGLSEILTNLKDTFDYIDRNLTLKGIKIIAERN